MHPAQHTVIAEKKQHNWHEKSKTLPIFLQVLNFIMKSIAFKLKALTSSDQHLAQNRIVLFDMLKIIFQKLSNCCLTIFSTTYC